mmetsp:Transcript_45882/g.129814  ORF Transcript_45882/g.129814 Transcript_45882/m.129814 type:complete len:280 (-) Transcript_45882:265-1104(-)
MFSSPWVSRRSTTMTPLLPAFSTMDMMGVLSASFTMFLPTFWSMFLRSSPSSFCEEYRSAQPPPGTMPSSTAARVAFSASFRRSFTSCTSTSEAPPTLITATPPESFARRSLSLSFSYCDVVISMEDWIRSHRSLMSSEVPAPSRMTVSSFVMSIDLAVPSAAGSKVSSSLPPVSSLMSSAPQRVAMSCSMALRWSPKPGAFTAATLSPPRSLFTMRSASASPSISSAMMMRGFCTFATCSRMGRTDWTEEIFLSKTKTSGSSRSTFCVFMFVMKCGEM